VPVPDIDEVIADESSPAETDQRKPYRLTRERWAFPRRVNYVFVLAIALTFVGYFLPWLSVPQDIRADQSSYELTGFTVPFKLNELIDQRAKEFKEANEKRRLTRDAVPEEPMLAAVRAFRSLYVLYLIPFLALLLLVEDIVSARNAKNRWWLRVAFAFSLPVAFVLIYVMFQTIPDAPYARKSPGPSEPVAGGIGILVSACGSVLALVSVFFFRLRYNTDLRT